MENQPIVANQPVLEMPKTKRSHTIFAVIISVVVTAAIAGGGVYFWQNMELKTVQNNLATAQNNFTSTEQLLKQQITVLQTQLEEKSQAVTSSGEYVALMDQLNETKFKLALLDFKRVSPYEVFADPQNKNKFYFVSNHVESSAVTVSSISVYDFAKDQYFQENGIIHISEGSSMLFDKRLDGQREFRGVGIIDNKFVFVETSIDDSPGPCFSNWFYRNLSYIDLGVANPTRKDFTLSDELKAVESQKATECQNSL